MAGETSDLITGDSSDDDSSTDTTIVPAPFDVHIPFAPTEKGVTADIENQRAQLYAKRDQLNQELQKSSDTYLKQVKALQDQTNAKIAQITADEAKMPQQQAIPTAPNVTQETKKNVAGAAWKYLMVALPIAYLFGRHNKYAMAGAMMGLGEGMKALSKGAAENAQGHFDNYQKTAELMQKQNTQRLNAYKEIISNDKLSLDTQMKQVEELGKIYHEGNVVKAAQSKDIDALEKVIAGKEKALKEHGKTVQDNIKLLYPGEKGAAYRSWYKATYGHFPEEDENPKKTFSDWLDDQKKKEEQPKAEKESLDEQHKRYPGNVGAAYINAVHEKYGKDPKDIPDIDRKMPYTEFVKKWQKEMQEMKKREAKVYNKKTGQLEDPSDSGDDSDTSSKPDPGKLPKSILQP